MNGNKSELNWNTVHQEKLDSEYSKRFIAVYYNVIQAMSATKANFNVETNELAETAIAVVMSQVVTDLMPMCGIEIPPVIVPADLEQDDAAVVRGNENLWYIGLDVTLIQEALSSRNVVGPDADTNPDNKTAKLVYDLAHEMGHIRQKEVLGMVSPLDQSLAPEIVANIIENYGEERGNKMIKRMEYEANIAETHANAFAVRYINAKKREPNVKSFWRDLDLQEQIKKKWRHITDALLAKKLTSFINRVENRNNALANNEGAMQDLIQSYEAVKVPAIAKILDSLR